MPVAEVTTQLQPVLNIACVRELKDELTGNLSVGSPLCLDASAVERVDACALQLLFAFIAEAAARGITWRWVGVSDALRDSAELCGMRASLGLV